jgi:hypothetical protein
MIARVRITDAERRVLEKGLLAPPAFRERRHRRLALLAYAPSPRITRDAGRTPTP